MESQVDVIYTFFLLNVKAPKYRLIYLSVGEQIPNRHVWDDSDTSIADTWPKDLKRNRNGLQTQYSKHDQIKFHIKTKSKENKTSKKN